VTRDGKIEQRVLAVGRTIDNGWLVSAGIADGDRVVVEGSQFVHPGQDVSAVEVTINQETGELRQGQSRQPTEPAKN